MTALLVLIALVLILKGAWWLVGKGFDD